MTAQSEDTTEASDRTPVWQKAGDQLQRLTLNAVENGVGPIASSRAYADTRLHHANGNADDAIKRIIRESVAASGGNGFVTGVGGVIAMPVSIPANVAGALVINARMVGAIAHLRGFDLDDPHTQAMLMLTVAGSSAQSVASALGVKVGQQLAFNAIKMVPIQVIRQINRKVGFFLVAKYGTKRATITLAKAVPGVGGLVGGGVDAALTRAVGAAAKKVFPPSMEPTPAEA